MHDHRSSLTLQAIAKNNKKLFVHRTIGFNFYDEIMLVKANFNHNEFQVFEMATCIGKNSSSKVSKVLKSNLVR